MLLEQLHSRTGVKQRSLAFPIEHYLDLMRGRKPRAWFEAAKELGANAVDSFLAANGLGRGDIGSWVFHPGGRKILQTVEATLQLREQELRLSWESLERIGHLSSASVLSVQEDTMTRHRPPAGRDGVNRRDATGILFRIPAPRVVMHQ